jgi:hypothetical protein
VGRDEETGERERKVKDREVRGYEGGERKVKYREVGRDKETGERERKVKDRGSGEGWRERKKKKKVWKDGEKGERERKWGEME